MPPFAPPLTRLDRKYRVIYADPPWAFSARTAKGTGRAPVSHYDCLDLRDLARLPVAGLADRDCALFLWAVDPMLDQAIELIRAWGFAYKTVAFYWVKSARTAPGFFTGLGYWTRANPEPCLLATRGAPRRNARDVKRLVVEPRREHSRKPASIRTAIERLAEGPYLELFARESRPGWDAWGNEAALFDAAPGPTRRQPSTLTAKPR